MTESTPKRFVLSPITLAFPITVAGETLTELPLRLLTKGEHGEVWNAHAEGNEVPAENAMALYLGLGALVTGLPEATLRKLKRPDYNSLSLAIQRQSQHGAGEFDKSLPGDDHERLKLLQPITDADGEVIEELRLEVPDVETSLAMERIPLTAGDKRNWYLNQKCTRLGRDELDRLSLPDWNSLQERLTDFLAEAGESFSTPDPLTA